MNIAPLSGGISADKETVNRRAVVMADIEKKI
jgi:hypothetical protein